MIANLDEVHQAHRRFLEANRIMVVDALRKAGDQAVTYVQGYRAGFKKRSGAIGRETKRRALARPGGAILFLENHLPYAAALDKGSPPHTIWARNKNALRFVAGGAVIFRRVVHHPGNKPYRFLADAAKHAHEAAGVELGRRMNQLARFF